MAFKCKRHRDSPCTSELVCVILQKGEVEARELKLMTQLKAARDALRLAPSLDDVDSLGKMSIMLTNRSGGPYEVWYRGPRLEALKEVTL